MKDNNKSTGFEYYPSFNQKKATEMQLEGKLDAIDLMIFEMLVKYSSFAGCRKKHESEGTYFFFSWKLVPQRMPFLSSKSRSPVKRRVSKLIENNFLEAHEGNQKNGTSWYRFGKSHGQYFGYQDVEIETDPSRNQDATRPEKDTPPSRNQDATRPEIRTRPVPKSGHNEFTYELTYNELTKERGKNPPFSKSDIEDFDNQADKLTESDKFVKAQREIVQKEKSSAKKEKKSLRETEQKILEYLKGEGLDDWKYSQGQFKGTKEQAETEVGMCLANMATKNPYKLQQVFDYPASIISILRVWHGHSWVQERGKSSLNQKVNNYEITKKKGHTLDSRKAKIVNDILT